MTIAKIKKALKGRKLNIKNVETIIKDCGYTVIYFNTPMGDSEISRYYLDTEKATLKAFTYYENARIVFVDNNLHTEDKLYLLLHELGHIVLGHVGDGKLVTRNKILIDIEADNFAYSILNNKRNWLYVILFVFILYSVIITAGFLNTRTAPADTSAEVATQAEPPQATEQNTDTVFVTPTGKKYHKQNCMYVKGKNLTELTRTQAENIYTPCSVCNP